MAMSPAQDSEGLSLEGMAFSDDRDLGREVLQVGSVSCVSLTGSITTC